MSTRKNIKTSKNLKGFDQKTILHTSAAKGLKLKVKRFRGLITTFIEVTEAGGGGGDFATPILNRVKDFFSKCDQIRRKVRKCGFVHIY